MKWTNNMLQNQNSLNEVTEFIQSFVDEIKRLERENEELRLANETETIQKLEKSNKTLKEGLDFLRKNTVASLNRDEEDATYSWIARQNLAAPDNVFHKLDHYEIYHAGLRVVKLAVCSCGKKFDVTLEKEV